MIAVLKYEDYGSETSRVYNTLAIRKVEIIKTITFMKPFCPKIVIRVKDNDELNQVVSALNRNSKYGVKVLKIRSDRTITGFFKKLLKKRETYN